MILPKKPSSTHFCLNTKDQKKDKNFNTLELFFLVNHELLKKIFIVLKSYVKLFHNLTIKTLIF